VTTLIERMREELVRRHYAESTIRSYLHTIEDFRRYTHKRLDHLGPDDIRRYQVYLLEERQLNIGTASNYAAALRFFYVKTLKRPDLKEEMPYPLGVKQKRRLPVILSQNQRLPAVAARLPGRPNPFRGVEKSCAFKFSFAKVFLKVQARAKRLSSQGRNQCLSMRNHDYLRVSGCGQNQSRKRRQQVRVQAGFRLVQNHQLGWTWCKQGCDPEQKA
jgi:hypothetical protein